MPLTSLARLALPVVALVGSAAPTVRRAPDGGERKRPAPRRAAVHRAPEPPRTLLIPVVGVAPGALRDGFTQPRRGHVHHAIDIMAARGTPVVSATGGKLLKLHRSRAGGLMVYAADASDRFILMYAHLDRYAAGLVPGATLRRGQLLGYVGTTGNAPVDAPHLHFAVARGRPSERWWKGDPVNPFPLLARGQTLASAPATVVTPRTAAPRAMEARRTAELEAMLTRVTAPRATRNAARRSALEAHRARPASRRTTTGDR